MPYRAATVRFLSRWPVMKATALQNLVWLRPGRIWPVEREPMPQMAKPSFFWPAGAGVGAGAAAWARMALASSTPAAAVAEPWRNLRREKLDMFCSLSVGMSLLVGLW